MLFMKWKGEGYIKAILRYTIQVSVPDLGLTTHVCFKLKEAQMVESD